MSTNPIAFARELLRCRSITPHEGGALSFLEKMLFAAGFAVDRITFTEPRADDVENLYARIGTDSPHLVFAGHTDVVPPGDEACWRHPPFAGHIADGALFGRGAVDMKGAIACQLAAVLDYLVANGGKPKGSISFLITGDEEGTAVNGTIKLLQWAAARGEKFDHCILGEPTNPKQLGDMVKIGRRGSLNGTLIVTGTQGHVAYPALANNPVRRIVAIMTALMAEPLDNGSPHFDPSNLEFISVDVGNKTVNVIPSEARARFNIRFNDRHTQASLKALVEARVSGVARGRHCRIEWDPSNANAFLTQPGPFVELVSEAIAEITGCRPQLSTTGGTSDARFIKDYCPVVEFGLVNATMHKIDENVPTDDLVALTAIYRRVLDRYFA
jgi:succinyl-diaminopimelate desuccinylase